MRNFNKLLSLALAVLMVLSVCSVLTAAEETALPEGAIAIDNIGYHHTGSISIMGGDGLKVSDFTAFVKDDGTESFKDMNYAAVVLVDRYDIVTEVRTTIGEPKSDMTCPDGGYLISYNANKEGYEVINTIEVGDKITLYNVDRALFPNYIGKDNFIDIANAGFVAEKPQNIAAGKTYTKTGLSPTYPDNDDKELTDGVFYSSNDTYGDPVWMGFDGAEKNVIMDLGGLYKVSKLEVEVGELGAGIWFPDSVEYFISENGEDWASLGMGTAGDAYNGGACEEVTLDGAAAIGRYVKAAFTNDGWVFVSEFEVFGHEIEDKNVALGKPYTIIGLHPSAESPAYPDTDNKELTNGTKVPADGSPSNSEWVGFNASSTDYAGVPADKIRNVITVDLGGEYAMSKFSYQYLDGVWGIAGPGELEILVDGVLVGKATKGSAPIDEAVLVLDKPAIGSIVTFSSTYAPNWVFVSEIEVFGHELTNGNVAFGKPYTKVGLYTGTYNYPDNDDKELTDGVLSSNGEYTEPGWVGLNDTEMNVTVDLGGLYKVNKLEVELGNQGYGICFPESVEYFISDNGEDWTSLGMGIAGEPYFENQAGKVTLDGVAAIGRYVKGVFTNSGFVFISEFEVFGHKAQKPMTVELPEEAIKIDNIGYHHTSDVNLIQIIAGDDKTVEELTGGKDLNWNRIIVVDSEGIVVRTYHKTGRPDPATGNRNGSDGPKQDIKCPVGGYILCIDQDLAIAGKLIQDQNTVADTVHPGDHITLYNVYLREVRAHRGLNDFTDVENAGFTIERFNVDGKMLPITTINGKLPPETNGLFTKYTATADDVQTYGTAWTKFRRLWHIDGNVYRVADDIWAFGGNVAPLDEGDVFLAVACNGAEGAANLFGNYVAYGLKKGDFIKIVGDITEDGEADAAAHIYIIRPDPDFVPVEFEKTEGKPKLQKGDWAGLDALLDGDLAEDITCHDGNHSKLVAIKNTAKAEETAKYNLVFNFKDGKTANTVQLYILNQSSGNVGLPESATVIINGESFEATVEQAEDGKMNVLTASFGKDMTFTKAVIAVVNPKSDDPKDKYNCFSEVVFASVTAEPEPVEFEETEGTPVLQEGAWAGLDALLDGDLAEDITGYEGNQGKLVAIQNPGRANEAAKYNLVFNFEEEKTANTAKLYILNYSNGCVGLPESVTVTINGETFEATVEPEDGKINVLTASFGKDMTFTKAVITVVNPQSDVCSSEFNCFSEVVFASETAEQPPVGGDTSEGDTSEGDTSEGDTSEGDTSGTTSAEPTPETGDVGIVLFVILAGVALAVAVIIRKRA